MVLALLLTAGAAFYFYQQLKEAKPDTTAVAAPEDVAKIVAKVGKLILLPEGEVPSVATVSNPEKLRDQPFFAHAREGDQVLVYTTARRVYLYDPVDNILVNVAPLSVEASAPSSTSGG